MPQEQITSLLKTIDDSVTGFIADLPATERSVYNHVLTLVKDLEFDKLGGIKNNVKNLRLLSRIRKEVDKIVLSKPYLGKVKEFVTTYDTLAELNNTYFAKLNVEFTPKKVLDEIKLLNIETTVDQLTESGIAGNFSNDIKQILKRNITSGGSYADLANQLRDGIIGVEGQDGRLVKYAKQISTDAVNQYNAQYTQAVTEDLGLTWYIYQGSLLTSSREFCIHLTKKRFFHKSEIPELLKGHVNGHNCKINPKTDLPNGFIPNTDENNFFVNRAGFSCGHQIFPVSKAAVPKELLEKFSD